jgi:hypothetical protein
MILIFVLYIIFSKKSIISFLIFLSMSQEKLLDGDFIVESILEK